MAKMGIEHDYDLMANAEESAKKQVPCAVCDKTDVYYQWSDYSGEGMCTQCGCPYQLKWGSDAQKDEGAYPYMGLHKEFLPIAREYWAETKLFVCYGMVFAREAKGLQALNTWVKEHHPEYGKDKDDDEPKGDDDV